MSFLLHDPVTPVPKCYASYGALPAYIDPNQPPANKVPIRAIRSCPFAYEAELLMPEELYEFVWTRLEGKIPSLEYARVVMPLGALLEGEFFNSYIKIGNILLLSEGRAGIDNTYSLRDGFLRLDLDKPTYERAGLVGKPIRSGGRKHVKERYLIELNLRLPSMLHGKKGFERIVWAFKNVLTQPVAWLFCDLSGGIDKDNLKNPLKKHAPSHRTLHRDITRLENVLVPSMSYTPSPDLNQASTQQHQQNTPPTTLEDLTHTIPEYLALASLASERINATDDIDPYLSRYQVPGHESDDNNNDQVSNLVKVRWTGFIHTQWILALFVACLSTSRKLYNSSSATDVSKAWFALTVRGMGKAAVEGRDGYVVLVLPEDVEDSGIGEGDGGEIEATTKGDGLGDGEFSRSVVAETEAEAEAGGRRLFGRCVSWEFASSG